MMLASEAHGAESGKEKLMTDHAATRRTALMGGAGAMGAMASLMAVRKARVAE